MRVGTQLRRAVLAPNYDAIIIGSGIGGLASAACLAKAGRNVLVCERHDTAGGFTHTFSRKQYVWDVGVHYIGDVSRPNCKLRRIFDYITNAQLGWESMGEVYDAIEVDGATYELVTGRTKLRNKLYGYFPKDKAAIDRYFDLVSAVGRSSSSFFMQKALPPALGRVLYRPMSRPFLALAEQTTGAVMADLTDNRTLIRVLTGQWGDYGLPPEASSFAMHAMVAGHYFGGASYPVGGAASIAANIEPVIKAGGGQIITGAAVAGVLQHRGKASGVKLMDGQEIRSSCVISDAGVEATYGYLLGDADLVPPEAAAYLRRRPHSMGHVCLYVGLRGSGRKLGLSAANLWLHRSSTADENFRRLSELLGQEAALVFISFPSVKDPEWDLRHPDTATIEIIAPAAIERFAEWDATTWQKRGASYQAWKADVAAALLEVMYSRLPDLRPHVDMAELSTPLSTRHFAGYRNGEIYGLSHDPIRFKQSWLRCDTALPGLYLTGQDLVTCGVGGAIVAGVLTAARVLGPKDALGLIRHTLVS